MSVTGQAFTRRDQLSEFLYNSESTVLPDHLYSVVVQEERHFIDKSDLRIKCPDLDTYRLAKEIESDCLAKSDRHEIRQQLATYIAENAGNRYWHYERWIKRLEAARTTGCVGVGPDGRHITAWDDKVNCVRLCPDEAREECQRLTRKYAPHILKLLKENPRWRVYYAVYTNPNTPSGTLLEGKKSQYQTFANMHRSRWFKDRVKGSFVIQEDPLSRHNDWNVHLNAIHIVEGDFSYAELRKQWSHNVHVQQIEGSPENIAKAFMEAVKYAAKHIGEKSEDGKHTVAPGMTSWPFERFDEWFEAGKGFRRSRSYGCLYRIDTEPEKSTPLEDIAWIGTMEYDVNGYRVHLKRSAADVLGVDLIQADNSTTPRRIHHNSRMARASQRPPDIH